MRSLSVSPMDPQGEQSIVHHPVFAEFARYSGKVPAGFQVDFLGALMCRDFVMGAEPLPPHTETTYPPIDEEYFEWIDILESVCSAQGEYVMFELGAGYGRWAVRAACALRQRGAMKCHLLAIEPEPKHFQWLRQHFLNNSLDPEAHTLLQAVVRDVTDDSLFLIGSPEGRNFQPDRWYGQGITNWSTAALYAAFRVLRPDNGRQAIKVPSVTLQNLLKDFECVDLIDFDLQGEELKVIRSALDALDRKVARLHIGTHGRKIETGLRASLAEHGWNCLADYPSSSTSETPCGPVSFQDGVQSWINPRLASVNRGRSFTKVDAVPAEFHAISDAEAEIRLLDRARVLFEPRELAPYPGWHFDIDWYRDEPKLQERRTIWSSFYSAGKLAELDVEWHGVRLTLYLGNDLSKQLFITGCLDPNEFALLNRFLEPGMRFVDAGANEGLYALFAAARVTDAGEVWAFEPSSRELARLRHNCSLNGFSHLKAVGCALSDASGVATLSVAEEGHAGHNTLGQLSDGVRQVLTEEVPVRTLDDIAAAENWERVDVLKIDVEGAELRLLEGARHVLLTMRPLILFECSPAALERNRTTVTQLLDLLRGLDYAIYWFHPNTGLPALAGSDNYSDNMVAAPKERPFPFITY